MVMRAKRTPLYSQIREYIMGGLHQNKWRANDHLPTEAELAEQFAVSRFTVKKALAELVTEGLIYRVQGKGSFISPHMAAQQEALSPSESMPGTFKPIVFLAPWIDSTLIANMLAGAEKQLTEQNIHLVCRSSRNNAETERQILQDCIRAGVRGIIIFPVDGESYNEEILRLTLNKFPIVVIDRYLRGVETNCVCSDNAGGAFDATSHLVELGHRNIAFVCVYPAKTTSLEDRLAGYERALTKHQIAIDHNRCLVKFLDEPQRQQEGEDMISADKSEVVRTFLQLNPDITAVVAATTESGMIVMKAAEELGISVPGQLSVIHFDDYRYSTHSRIPPSCVVQQEIELGEEAAKLLMSVIDNPLQERRQLTLPTRLVLRDSTSSRNVQ